MFERRADASAEAVLKNLGTALALEIISNRSLIPGEKRALVDSGNYGVTLGDSQMHYLAEHWGEVGAEQQHENNVIQAVSCALTRDNEALIVEGVNDFLDALNNLWSTLDRLLVRANETTEAPPLEGGSALVSRTRGAGATQVLSPAA